MFNNCVPALYIYMLCSCVCPGALTEQPLEQRVQQLEIVLHKVSQLLEQCTANVDVMREEMEQCTSNVDVMRDDMDEFAAEITQKVDDVVRGITTNMSDVIDDIRDEITDVKQSSVSMSDIGTSYVRWGRTSCPVGEERVYVGFMSGTYISDDSGTNYQCLPLNVEYANFASGTQSHGRIYGVEYSGVADTIYDMTNLEGSTFINQNVPCSLCHATNRTTVQMFPAQTQCPAGWTLEYWGYLVSSHYSGSGYGGQTTYECMDNAPSAVINGAAAQTAAEIYNVEVTCGNVLPCPEYIAGYELTCVVCTK